MVNKDVLFLILARSGSKGVPNKNIRLLGGKPLLAYRILSAKKSTLNADIVLSTDSEQYAEIGKTWGADVPFLRPAHLSSDTANSVDAVLHAIEYLEQQEKQYKYICLIEPTSPFTKIEWVDDALRLMILRNAETLVACKYTSPHPNYIQDESEALNVVGNFISQSRMTNRQAQKKQITPSGNFYISETAALKKTQSFYSEKTLTYMIPAPHCLEIDTEFDFLWAEFLIEKNLVN